jgi:uncharacterized phage protein gp47/JayE
MTCTGTGCTCGCCAGTSVQTPQAIDNLPGLPAVGYRVGSWAAFKESMLARLSSSEYPALAPLKTRTDDDFTIAFLDATSIVLDILTFYQERLANESYLRTATQLRSLTELSRLIGYQPAPGVSASAYLAFTLKTAPGHAPDPSASAITIPAGTRAQSVPAQGQTPQTFETSAAIAAKAAWNALPVQTGQPWTPPGANGVYLSGTATQLQVGDWLLILGAAREQWDPSLGLYRWADGHFEAPREQWALVAVESVQVDTARKLTYVSWGGPVGHSMPLLLWGGRRWRTPDWTTAKVFALRQRAALFGHNAPSPYLFVNLNAPAATPATSLPSLITVASGVWSWNNYQIQDAAHVDLDAAYPKLVPGSWLVLASGGAAQLYRISSAASISRSAFAMSGKVTELALDYADPALASLFPLQGTEVLGQSEQLTVAEQPLTWPLYGTALDLDGFWPDLAGVTAVALSGTSQKLAVADGVFGLMFTPDDVALALMLLNPGDLLTVTDPSGLPLNPDGSPPDWLASSLALPIRVQDAAGRPGTVTAAPSQFTLAPASTSDPVVREFALVSSVAAQLTPYPHTRIQLQANLQYCYNRAATSVNANVALATHGQSVSEIMGSGSSATPNQSFTLRQSPLTYVHAPTPSGRQSTLQVRANGVLWAEAPSLYQRGPAQQVFATLSLPAANQPGITTEVLFGDGVEGSTLPTGQNNLQASYRIGSGSAGNVAAAAITTLIDRPLGVSGVINPSAATGGQDPQAPDAVRASAPQTVLTLGRAVSLADYQNFAATFAGVAKAYATWIPSGPGRGVFLTVAGVGGAALPPGSPTLTNLAASLRSYGNPLLPITVASYVETLFSFTASLRADPRYVQSAVEAAVIATLTANFSFAARSFGQRVGLDEITAIIQAVPGVVAVTVTGLTRGISSTGGDLDGLGGTASVSGYNQWLAGQVSLTRQVADTPLQLYAALPIASRTALPQPAEILVLAPGQILFGVLA